MPASPLQKISHKKDFLVIFKKGKSTKKDCLLLKSLKNQTSTHRFAFVVSQKISKKAVVRNKVRRRLSEIARKYPKKGGADGLDMVFVALPGIEKKSFAEVKEAMETLLTNSSI